MPNIHGPMTTSVGRPDRFPAWRLGVWVETAIILSELYVRLCNLMQRFGDGRFVVVEHDCKLTRNRLACINYIVEFLQPFWFLLTPIYLPFLSPFCLPYVLHCTPITLPYVTLPCIAPQGLYPPRAYLRTRASGQWSNPVGARRLLAPPAAADLVRGRYIAAPMTCAPLHLFRVCVPTPRFLCMSASCSQVLTRDPANPSTDSSQ